MDRRINSRSWFIWICFFSNGQGNRLRHWGKIFESFLLAKSFRCIDQEFWKTLFGTEIDWEMFFSVGAFLLILCCKRRMWHISILGWTLMDSNSSKYSATIVTDSQAQVPTLVIESKIKSINLHGGKVAISNSGVVARRTRMSNLGSCRWKKKSSFFAFSFDNNTERNCLTTSNAQGKNPALSWEFLLTKRFLPQLQPVSWCRANVWLQRFLLMLLSKYYPLMQ